jgi:hypothetical protein
MKLSRTAVAATLGLAALSGRAEASAVIDIRQVGGNVMAIGSGTIDLSGLTFLGPGSEPAELGPDDAVVFVGLGPGTVYKGLSGPASFGPGAGTLASSASGDRLGLEGADSFLFVPAGYVSGAALSGSATFDGQTFATLGLTPGTYVYTWGSSPALDDSLTVKIAIPEPSTWVMLIIGAGAIMGGFRVRPGTPIESRRLRDAA